MWQSYHRQSAVRNFINIIPSLRCRVNWVENLGALKEWSLFHIKNCLAELWMELSYFWSYAIETIYNLCCLELELATLASRFNGHKRLSLLAEDRQFARWRKPTGVLGSPEKISVDNGLARCAYIIGKDANQNQKKLHLQWRSCHCTCGAPKTGNGRYIKRVGELRISQSSFQF